MLAHEKPMAHPEFNEHTSDEFTLTVAQLMQDSNYPFAIWLAFKGRRAIGFLGGEIQYRSIGTPHYYCTAHWLYVRPEHRGRGVAADLIAVGLEWLQEQQLPILNGDGQNPTHIDTVELAAAYEDDSWMDRGFIPFTTRLVRSVTDLSLGRAPSSKKKYKGERAHGRK
jgi:GNAT superfamily N-acetyltransferase